jgi:uncharacterized protein with HEPN domain
MKKDPKIFIEHILESIEAIQEYLKGFSKEKQDAVIRRMEIIGEAVKNISDEIKGKYLDIPWRRIAGMRDILIHEYFGVDLELTWEVVRKEMVNLKKEMLKIKEEL